ncbi:Carbamoyl-phosphate synthase small subunit, N-terminal domain [Dillenia turbinata]|uniref:Carbamoyl-phosphate synthase small subunit, N-terminal domain n=1 Tax=Dillenia turbinata TaxID=194707 RepID=A0AAN8YTN5_9MAGN
MPSVNFLGFCKLQLSELIFVFIEKCNLSFLYIDQVKSSLIERLRFLLKIVGLEKARISLTEFISLNTLCMYKEILTDPSYAGQFVLMTNPHIGNTSMMKNRDSVSLLVKSYEVLVSDDVDTYAISCRQGQDGSLIGVLSTEQSKVMKNFWRCLVHGTLLKAESGEELDPIELYRITHFNAQMGKDEVIQLQWEDGY